MYIYIEKYIIYIYDKKKRDVAYIQVNLYNTKGLCSGHGRIGVFLR